VIPPPETKQLDIRDYLNIVRKRLWIILSFLGIGIGIVTINILIGPKVYMSTTTVLIEAKILRVTAAKGRDQDIYDQNIKAGKQYLETQRQLLKAVSLASKVLEKLDPTRYPEYTNQDPVNAAKSLVKMVDVNQVKGTNIVEVSVLGDDPGKITELANIWAEEFINQDLEKRRLGAEYGVTWLDTQLMDISAKLQESEKRLNKFIKVNKIVAMPDIEKKGEVEIERLQSQRIQLETEIETTSKSYGENHPVLVSLQSQLKAVENALVGETENFLKLQDKLGEYNVLKREVDAYQVVYDDFIQRARDLSIFKKLDVSQIQIVDRATVPKTPIKPQPAKELIIAIIMSLSAGVAICVLLEFMDTSLRNPDDVEFFTKIPILGAISHKTELESEPERAIVSYHDPSSQIAEAFRHIRVALDFASSEQNGGKAFMVTSAGPKEGKSFVASSMAISYAEANEATLLIDADMKKGRLGESFGIEAENGLSSLLAGVSTFEDVILPTSVSNLSFLPSGPYVPSSVGLLRPEKLREILKKMCTKFNRVIIDVPAVSNAPDALIWADQCDNVTCVVKAGKTSVKHLNETKKKLQGKSKIVGAILNIETKEKKLLIKLPFLNYLLSALKKRPILNYLLSALKKRPII